MGLMSQWVDLDNRLSETPIYEMKASVFNVQSGFDVLANQLKTVSGHHTTGGVLEVDLSPHGSIRYAGTREYR